MSDGKTVAVERELACRPETLWRALSEPHLVAEWLMPGDVRAVVGHTFSLGGAWGSVDCRVTEVVPNRVLAYTWSAYGLESVVTWTLTPTAGGTRLRMEQVGFRPEQTQFRAGAEAAWPGFFDKLAAVVARENAVA